ncbi:MAG: hypothetical protein ABF297_13325, partial [Thiogranum sp.]
CTCGEENLLGYPGDPYADENILIHEFAHNIHLRGMANIDPTFDTRLQKAYEKAMAAGLWKNKYAATNRFEYFAEGVQSWFGNNRENDHDHPATGDSADTGAGTSLTGQNRTYSAQKNGDRSCHLSYR